MHDRLFLGVTGLATDVQTLSQLLKFRMNLYRLREEREIKPQAFSALLTSSHVIIYLPPPRPLHSQTILPNEESDVGARIPPGTT